jgi:hypothetical protein
VELPDTIRITIEVARAMEALQITYLVGGSIASSIHGFPRSTQDADLVADLRPEHVRPLVASLEKLFYIDSERVMDAIRRRASFNAIHLREGLKVDVFVLKSDPFSRQEMARRRRIAPLEDPGDTIPIASPEDIVLQKLRWYRLGNGVSDQQWNDILGVLKVQRGSLDLPYLQEWAERIEVEDLLEKALQDAGIDPAAG